MCDCRQRLRKSRLFLSSRSRTSPYCSGAIVIGPKDHVSGGSISATAASSLFFYDDDIHLIRNVSSDQPETSRFGLCEPSVNEDEVDVVGDRSRDRGVKIDVLPCPAGNR